jgi:tetratricopeptide (TPR) repeat protein
LFLLLIAALPGAAQLRKRDEDAPKLPANMEDEDEDFAPPTEYAFNPIQAQKELNVGDFYARKGSHRAAANRYLEATKWNPSYAEAFWKLARSKEKLGELPKALEAYQKFVELEPDGSQAKDVRKKITEIEKKVQKEAAKESSPQ